MKNFQTFTFLFLLLIVPYFSKGQLWKQYADSAKTFNEQKNMDKAIEFYAKSREELKRDSLSTSTYAEICNNLGVLYDYKGKYEKAESLHLEAKQIREKVVGKAHPSYALSCNNLANLYKEMGLYEKAEPLHLEAKQIREKVLGKDHISYAASCNNLANLYNEMGLHKKAELLYLEAREILEKVFGKKNANYAWICDNLGVLYKTMGLYEKAEPLHLEAKEIRAKVLGKDHIDYAKGCGNLAILYNEMGQYEKAELLYLEARQTFEKVLGKEHPDYTASSFNLANLYWHMGQFEKAEPLYLEARQVWGKVLGNEHPDYASSCYGLANLYRLTGQYQKAEPLYVEAKQMRGKVFGKEHRVYALSCYGLANLYRLMGQYEKAEPLYIEAKEIYEKTLGREHNDYAVSCKDLATLYWNQEKPVQAHALYAEAFHYQNSRLSKIFQFTSEVEKQSYLKKISDLSYFYLSFITSTFYNSNQGFSYDVSLFNRNLILSTSQKLRQEIYASTDTSVKSKYNTWMSVREQLSFWYAKPVPQRPAYITHLEEQANSLEKELTRLSSTFKQERTQSAITWKDIQHHLKSNEAAIEFVHFGYFNGKRLTDSTYYIALVLKKEQAEPILIHLFESLQLSKLLGAGTTLNTISALYQNGNKPADVYSLIWKPFEEHLKGITKIYFAPTGLLHRISFAAIPFDDHSVLSDKYQLVQFNTTATIVDRADKFVDASDKLLLYGGIRYDIDSISLKHAMATLHKNSNGQPDPFLTDDISRGSKWQYLAGTETEINKIRALGEKKKYMLKVANGASASEESVKALSGTSSPAVLHIATHGFFFPDPKDQKETIEKGIGSDIVFRKSDNPLLRAGLLFAGANHAWTGTPINGVEDGILTAHEVSNLYLPNTKLVVLSACETGLGDIQGNEGVYGLQRAFKMAGVENLVMSLWKIPDQTTAEFMQEFYQGIFSKLSINDAFNLAQKIMKNRYRKEPYKWAAWVLIR